MKTAARPWVSSVRTDMTRQAVTKYLVLLEAANLVVTVRRGREKLHYLNPVPIGEIYERWIGKYGRQRLRALGELKRGLEQGKDHASKDGKKNARPEAAAQVLAMDGLPSCRASRVFLRRVARWASPGWASRRQTERSGPFDRWLAIAAAFLLLVTVVGGTLPIPEASKYFLEVTQNE